MSAQLNEILHPSQEQALIDLAEELRPKDKLAAALGVDARQFNSLGELATLATLREDSHSKPILRGSSERRASQKLACCWP